MGCVSSKIMAKSGSFQEKASHRFQRSSLIEEIILSNSKSSGDQFVALLCSSGSAAKGAEQSPPAAEPARIETISVAELLAGLDEEGKEHHHNVQNGCGAAGKARSFRTVEEFDALVAQSSSPEQAKPATLSPAEQEEAGTAVATTQGRTAEQEEAAGGCGGGAKRRARARQLGELKLPPAFDFSKSGSLRDWLLRGGQIFSPGSYVTPKFGGVAAPPSGEERPQHAGAVFDPELVAQFEQAMKQLSLDEEHVLKEILEAMEGGEKAETGRPDDQAVAVQN